MGTTAFPTVPNRRESLSATMFLSLVLHASLFGFAIGYAQLGLRVGGGGGKNWGVGNATRVNAVSSLPGVPLPAPMLATHNTLATENPGLYRQEPPPKPERTPATQEIPKFKEVVAQEKVLRVNKRIQKEELETPENAVPFGLGGKPPLTFSQFLIAAGEGGIHFRDGNFAERYSWYVSAVRTRISSNWLLSTVSPNILEAPRVYMTFDILRDGTVTNVQVTKSSGIPEVDRSALRAVLASNPLGTLPLDYSGSKVSVEFYFDFRRR